MHVEKTTDGKPILPDSYSPGLEDIVAGLSDIAEVDGELDALIYRGYVAHELAEKASYEEVSYLLLMGTLPNARERAAFEDELKSLRALSPALLSAMKVIPKSAHHMSALRAAVSFDSFEDPDGDKTDAAANVRKSKRLIAKAPTLVAALARLKNGQEPLAPHPTLSHAANFLYMLIGQAPDADLARILDASMVLYAEHGYNASTFSALVTASTLSDMHSAVCSAIGALKGPLHGGANEAAIEMMLKIGTVDNVEPWLKETLARKEKVMGFGHRVYRLQDSRAPFMKKLAEKMAARVGDRVVYPLSNKLEEAVKREKNLFPNVDYHCAVAYYLMGLPVEIYTAMFAMARMAGWTAHVCEQHAANRLIRPECIYTGARDLDFVPIEKRP